MAGSRLGLPVPGLRLHIHRLVGAVVDPVVPSTEPEESTTVTPGQIIYQRRVRVLDHARQNGNVSATCRLFGVSRKTFYQWRNTARDYGLDALMPKDRRPP